MAKCPYAASPEGMLPVSKWGEIVNIEVGKEKALFQIHEGLLRQHSVWFTTRLNGSWGDVKNVELPEDLPQVFELFEEFVYRSQLPAPAATTDGQDETENDLASKRRRLMLKHHSKLTLAQLYVFDSAVN